jgi:membrane-bound serine protease (ClpP class)
MSGVEVDMDILLDPNIAYLLLVSGFILVIFAVITPGTGLLEIGALFVLVLAGWEIYHLPVNSWALIVLIIGVVPFLLALRRKGEMIYLAVAILALVIGSIFLFRGDEWWKPVVNPILATVVSLISGGSLWMMVRKILEAEASIPTHDRTEFLGMIGEAKTDIYQEGSVYVGGEEWTAWSEEPIPNASRVRIVGREGFVLEVERVETSEED